MHWIFFTNMKKSKIYLDYYSFYVTQQVIQWNCPQEVKSCWLVRTGFCVLFRIRNQLERFPGCIKLHGKIWSESPIWCPRVNVRTTVLTPWTTFSVFYWLEGCIMMIVIVIICNHHDTSFKSIKYWKRSSRG
jgi:hypothetical protein